MKIIKFFKSLVKELKDLWNVYGGILLSTLIAWWSKWSKSTIDVWTSYLTLSITCIGLLTFFKIVIFNNNKKGKVDGLAMSKTAKTVRTAIDPLQPGREIGEAIIYTAKGGQRIMGKLKNLIKWLWGNKLTLTSIISNLVVSAFAQFIMYSDTLKDVAFFQEHDLIFKIVVGVLCALWLADNIFCVVTKYGLENLKELKAKSEEKKQEQLNKLTKEQKQALKQTLGGYKTAYNDVIGKINGVLDDIKKFEKIVSDFKLFESLKLDVTVEQINDYNNAKEQIAVLNNQKQALEGQKQDLEAKMSKVKNQL